MPYPFGIEKLEPAFDDRPVPYLAYGATYNDLTATHLAQTLAAERVYLIVSTSLSQKTSAVKRLEESIKSKASSTKLAGIHVGIAPHTPWQSVIDIANEIRAAFTSDGSSITDRDVIVTLGGGSIIDGAKVIAWILANPSITTSADLEELQKDGSKFNPPAVRVITIPTTLSGGEYNSRAGVTQESGEKVIFNPPRRNPSLVILDPDLATTTPKKYWLSTGVRAIDHCVETLCSLQSNDAADEAATTGLQQLIPSLLHTKEDGHDLDSRFDSMMGVRDAMLASSTGVSFGASHAIGHQLGPLGVGHGETSCVMLPAVCEWNLKQNANNERQEKCKRILLQDEGVTALMQKAGVNIEEAKLSDILDLVIRALGLPRKLSEFGVGKDKFDQIAQNTLRDRFAPTNAVPLTNKEQVLEILEMVV